MATQQAIIEDRGSVSRYAHAGEPVSDPAAWTGAEMTARDEWLYRLRGDELDGLSDLADRLLKDADGDLNHLIGRPAEAFDLGPLSTTVEAVRFDLRDGRGFAVMRGLPVEDWSREKLAAAYWAVGVHVGEPVSNNPEGDLISHVIDLGRDYDNPKHRGYQTSAALNWHVDNCDVVTLLCLQTSKTGGESKFASSVAVYNEMLRRRPDLVAALAEPFRISRHGEEDDGEAPYYEFPVFNFVDDYLVALCAGRHIEKGHSLPGAPPLTDARREALQMIGTLAEELHLSMAFEPGDIQLLNNFVNIHTRTAFEDWDDPARKRHLWRLWLHVEGQRAFPPEIEPWRRGIRTLATTERIELDPFV